MDREVAELETVEEAMAQAGMVMVAVEDQDKVVAVGLVQEMVAWLAVALK